MDDIKKEPLTNDTVIGSRKIAAAEFRKFFKHVLGDDYEKYPLAWDVIKMSSFHNGKSLKEIIDGCLNPKEQKIPEIIILEYQKKHKPKIEAVIPYILDGDMQKIALDFAAFLKASKISLRWQTWNRWVAICKGTAICGVELSQSKVNASYPKDIFWSIHPHLKNINEYENFIVNEGWQHFIWDNIRLCDSCRPPAKCRKEWTILGKRFTNICVGFVARHNRLNINNPDETTVQRMKKLLELEKMSRN